MTERWFDDLPEHDPDDPEAVERALRRQDRAIRRQRESGSGKTERRPSDAGGKPDSGPGRRRPGGSRGGSGRQSGRGRVAGLVLAAIVFIGAIWFLFALFQPFKGDGEGEPFPVKIPRGSSVGDIGNLLAEKGVVANGSMFEIRATLSGRRGSLSQGAHSFRRNMSYSAALDELEQPTAKKTITVTIPEGQSRSETASTVKAAGLPGSYMKASVSSPGFNPSRYRAPKNVSSLEGFLFPATYELKPSATVTNLVGEQLGAFTDNFATVNMKYARKKNLTPFDVLTIASMIEREVSVPRERRMVAAVIYNRLKMGEPLGIDATIRFATDNWNKPLTESELAIDSPYNTRTRQGLPPGPIGSPGLASIKAAANPAKTDAWLYVVKPGTCGEHVFSSTLKAHNRHVEAYQEAQAKAGGSPTECP